ARSLSSCAREARSAPSSPWKRSSGHRSSSWGCRSPSTATTRPTRTTTGTRPRAGWPPSRNTSRRSGRWPPGKDPLSKQVLQGRGGVGLRVPVLHDDGSLKRDSPLQAFAVADGAGSRDDDGARGNLERPSGRLPVLEAPWDVVDRSASRQDDSR